MNKIFMNSLVVLSIFSTIPAMASVEIKKIRFECPKASGGKSSQRLTNYGGYIRGMGAENIGANKILPIFNGKTGTGVPMNLLSGAYVHEGAQYNPATGTITCLFKSTVSKPSFYVSYSARNIVNGWVLKADKNTITIQVVAG